METPDLNYAQTKAAQEAQHEHERRLQQQSAEHKKKDRRLKAIAAYLSAGAIVLAGALTGSLALLGSYRQAAATAAQKSCNAPSDQIAQQTNPQKLLDGLGAAFQAMATLSLTPHIKPQATPVPSPSPVPPQPSQIDKTIPAPNPSEQSSNVTADLSKLCTTGDDSNWTLTPEPAIPQQNKDEASYGMNLRFENKSETDGFLRFMNEPHIADNAGNRLNVSPSIPMTTSGLPGVKVAAGQSSMFTVTTSQAGNKLGTLIKSFNITLVISPEAGPRTSKELPLSATCHDIPVLQTGH